MLTLFIHATCASAPLQRRTRRYEIYSDLIHTHEQEMQQLEQRIVSVLCLKQGRVSTSACQQSGMRQLLPTRPGPYFASPHLKVAPLKSVLYWLLPVSLLLQVCLKYTKAELQKLDQQLPGWGLPPEEGPKVQAALITRLLDVTVELPQQQVGGTAPLHCLWVMGGGWGLRVHPCWLSLLVGTRLHGDCRTCSNAPRREGCRCRNHRCRPNRVSPAAGR